MSGTLTLSYSDEDELDRKLRTILLRRGWRVERSCAAMETVGQLAKRLGLHAGSVSRALHRPNCPPFHALWGSGKKRRRILFLTANEDLVKYLSGK